MAVSERRSIIELERNTVQKGERDVRAALVVFTAEHQRQADEDVYPKGQRTDDSVLLDLRKAT